VATKFSKKAGFLRILVETTLLPCMDRQKRNPEEKPFSRGDAKTQRKAEAYRNVFI
jgi:hypothetical protein